ncbi:NAD-dependent protein deacylase Sirt4 [Tribolium madens]|uniref:NAD-dependent protein deacylase Sirt4 n=1 Tax=Tribolium madens TaxID=41895 RepID=UPI001CF74DF3|nr:NAD-dependent protein deacylase Sirt4 [Tribolium madens]
MSNLSKQLPFLLKRAPLLSDFIPKHSPAPSTDVQSLRNFVNDHEKILVLTGAGISTESGIPDYRSEDVGLYARTNHKPIQYQEFLKSVKARQRYWARNYIGWPKFSQTQPNITHYIVQFLESVGKVGCVVTQNVDSLHFKAGSGNVIELHGTAFRVICLTCGSTFDRHKIQEKLIEGNPDLRETSQMIRPDGDVEISQEKVQNFKPPFCDHCQGVLKPDITFFGDNVPKERVDKVRQNVTQSDSILVLGSSLSVFSGYRIILQAVEEKKDVAIVNIGPTRADKHAKLKISARCGDILPRIFE